MRGSDAFRAIKTDKMMVSEKGCSTHKELQDIDNDAESNQVMMLKE